MKFRSVMFVLLIVVITGLFVTAEESEDYYYDWLVDHVDPVINKAVYVYDQGRSAIVSAAEYGVEKATDFVDTIITNREAIKERIILTYNRTAAEAKALWDRHGAAVGRTLLIVADTATEGVKEFYSFSKKTAAQLAVLYSENEWRIQEFIDTNNHYVSDAVVYIGEVGQEAYQAAKRQAEKGLDWIREHEDEFRSGLRDVYLYTEGKVYQIKEPAEEKWVPRGIAMMEQAHEFYRAHEDEFKDAATAAGRALDRTYTGILTSVDRLYDNNKNKIAALKRYAGEKTRGLAKYMATKGKEHVESMMQVASQVYEYGEDEYVEFRNRTIDFYHEMSPRVREVYEGTMESIQTTAAPAAREVVRRSKEYMETASKYVEEHSDEILDTGRELGAKAADAVRGVLESDAARSTVETAKEVTSDAIRQGGNALKKGTEALGNMLGGW